MLERRAHAAARTRGRTLAVPLLAASGSLLAFGPSELYAAFAGLFGVLAAGALLTPLATVRYECARSRARPPRWICRSRSRFAASSASLSRTGVATAALAVAVATVNGVGLMIASFRTSLDAWLETTLTADLYVSATGDGAALRRPRGVGRVRGSPRRRRADADAGADRADRGGDVAIRAVQPGARGWGLALVAGDAAQRIRRVGARHRRHRFGTACCSRAICSVGDELELPSPIGSRSAYRSSARSATSIPASRRSSWRSSGIGAIGATTS